MSQVSSIKNHLNSGRTITPLEALDLYGCFRLAAVIFILKDKPHYMNIKTEEKTRVNGNGVTKRFAEYKCVSPEGNKEQLSMFSNNAKEFRDWLDKPPQFDEKKHIR